MDNLKLINLVDFFYKQAQSSKAKSKVVKPRAKVVKPKKKEIEYITKYPDPPKQRSIDIAKIKREQIIRQQQEEAAAAAADEKLRRQVAKDIFPTPIGNMSKSQLFAHYKEMMDRINSRGNLDFFNPGSIVSSAQSGNPNAEVPVCMVEGGEDIGTPAIFGTTPALLVRFCSSSNNPNPAISDMVGYVKKLLLSCGIQPQNYIIEPIERANNKIRNSAYAKYVYVALDMDEDKLADD